MLRPLQFMLPDLVTGDIGLVGTFHDPLQRFVIVAIELGFIETFSPFLDEGIVVFSLLQIEIPLPVVRIVRDKLPTHCFLDFSQYCFHQSKKIIGGLTAQILDAGLVETKCVTQFCRRST